MKKFFLSLNEYVKDIIALYDYRPFADQEIAVLILKKMNFLDFDKMKKELKGEKFVILTEDDIENGRDIFPLKLLHIKNHSALLLGEDIMENLQINKSDLRLNIESELRYKLVQLRESFLTTGGDTHFVDSILPVLEPIWEGILVLHDQKLIDDKKDLLAMIDNIFDTKFPLKDSLRSDFLLPLYEKKKIENMFAFVEKLNEYLLKVTAKINSL